MYRREPQKCFHHWNLTSEERLRTLKLPTLRFRRLRGDMIETLKIWTWIYDRKVTEDLFELNQESKSRSQHLRSKNKEVVWMSENVSLQTELWTYGTTLRKKSLVQKISILSRTLGQPTDEIRPWIRIWIHNQKWVKQNWKRRRAEFIGTAVPAFWRLIGINR